VVGSGQAHGSVLCHRHQQVHRRWHLVDPDIGTADLSLGLGPKMGILPGRPTRLGRGQEPARRLLKPGRIGPFRDLSARHERVGEHVPQLVFTA